MLQPLHKFKILILMPYYNRPKLIHNAIGSILKAGEKHSNWTLTVLDDGSEFPAEPIVSSYFGDKFPVLNTNMTIENKIRHGICLGRIANRALVISDADILVTLCDDDELHPDYLCNLNRFFLKNRECKYCYSKIHLYDPMKEKSSEVDNISGFYNENTGPIDCYGKVDGSQVAYRISALRDAGIWYRETTKSKSESDSYNPWMYNLDGEMFKQLSIKVGKACPTDFVAQYKGIHQYQLVHHKVNNFHCHDDIREYHRNIFSLANKEF